MLNQIGGTGRAMKITIGTMGVPHTMRTKSVTGLEIYDLGLNNCITIPQVYTKEEMPVSHGHIPGQGDIQGWSHLQDLELPSITAEIGLLIGNNVPDAYAPLETRVGGTNSPHATKSRLGWIIWNLIRGQEGNTIPTVSRVELMAFKICRS